ncbi:hypothetical protein SISSUDRAFT_1046794 [Sistotremastrum suecicum HHB10207 ss-3]|uniref:F-box domain-containing protein n=1 Tax=Sistotremastrum suecicum HHB10207 ss-3 TaxID=1314776 RepID=A0A166DKE4_9AGAM|nr:hypothetical protein SISSUDRAFT_1046794 [Sistotremastrum suecicum HHB10207 ss-3]
MGLLTMAPEIREMIFEAFVIDAIETCTRTKDRLKMTLKITQICRTLRTAAFDYHRFWSTIHLHWHADAVQFFLERARVQTNPDLHVFLDPQAGGTSNKRKKHQRWGKFLKEHMKIVRFLGIKITLNNGSPHIAAALGDTPAPRLTRFELDLDERQTHNANITRLFDNNAPSLISMRIHARAPFEDLPNFASLEELEYRVTEENFAGLLEMLERSPRLRYISLKGASRWTPSPLPEVNPALHTPVVLPDCSSLFIRGMDAQRTWHILGHISFPVMTRLDVYERIFEHDNDLMGTIFGTLPKLPQNLELPPKDWLFVGIRPNLICIELEGYRYQCNWTNFHFQNLTDGAGAHLLFSFVIDAVTAAATVLHLQPPKLHIENNITFEEDNPLSLDLHDLNVLLTRIFAAYPLVEELGLSGNTAYITQQLRHTHAQSLPLLTTLKLERNLRLNIPETYDADSVTALQRTRNLEIVNSFL